MKFELLTIYHELFLLQGGNGNGQRAGKMSRMAFFCLFCVAAAVIFPVPFLGGAEAATNISMSVEENPYNKVAAQLQQKEKNINEREALLNKYEKELQRGNMTLALFVLALFLLIMLNFYLDYHRRRLDEDKKTDNIRYLKL